MHSFQSVAFPAEIRGSPANASKRRSRKGGGYGVSTRSRSQHCPGSTLLLEFLRLEIGVELVPAELPFFHHLAAGSLDDPVRQPDVIDGFVILEVKLHLNRFRLAGFRVITRLVGCL